MKASILRAVVYILLQIQLSVTWMSNSLLSMVGNSYDDQGRSLIPDSLLASNNNALLIYIIYIYMTNQCVWRVDPSMTVRKMMRLPPGYWAEYCRVLHNTGPMQRNVTLLHPHFGHSHCLCLHLPHDRDGASQLITVAWIQRRNTNVFLPSLI